MKQLHAARHAVEAHMIRGFLHAQGIAAEVRGEYLTSGWGELPTDVYAVWIEDDAPFGEADELVRTFLKGGYARKFGGAAWTCPSCGESLEGQFTHCWKCGSPRAER